ncbi:MAG: hypothetical protein Kow0080_00020 [Candidatus Promineifilaceae bacterium]
MEIGLYYYNARYYAPTLARFLSPDTIVPDPANPQSFNRYSYALNSPIMFIDPSGHFSEEAIMQHISDICGGWADCIDETGAAWQQDTEWWAMLLAAEAGDVLYGTYDPYGGIAVGSFYYTFMGSGRERLDGIQFAGADSSELPPWIGGEFNWSGVGLSGIFSGRFYYQNDLSLAGYHIVRTIWQGVINNFQEIKPVFIRSTASVRASQTEAEYTEWLLSLQNGNSPSASEVVSAMITNVGGELTETAVCFPFDDVCSFVWAGIVGAYGEFQQDEYAYAVNSGPFTFYYSWTVGGPSISSGGLYGERHIYWLNSSRR